MERDVADWLKYENVINFNSHAHVERDEMYNTEFTQTLNFNSHAHVERDRYAIGKIKEYIISTHTLTWSVTDLGECTFFTKFISTHTLTWSVTI